MTWVSCADCCNGAVIDDRSLAGGATSPFQLSINTLNPNIRRRKTTKRFCSACLTNSSSGIQQFGAENLANRSSEGDRVRGMGGSSRLPVEPHGSDELMDDLIPGIPNEITVGNIFTKLQVADVLKLPLISRAWQQAVQSQEVRSARLRQHKADSLRVVSAVDVSTRLTLPSSYTSKIRLALQSSDHKFFVKLPAIPRSWTSQDQVVYRYMCLGTKIHVLLMNLRYRTIRTSVYMFDVTRGGQTWTESARSQVKIPKLEFATYRRRPRPSRCCLKDNKFYVPGVLFPARVYQGHMIYDPDQDLWSFTTDFQREASRGRCVCQPLGARSMHDLCFM